MKSFLVRRVAGVALHYPQHFAVVSQEYGVGEVGRAQTPQKAERLQRALELLERYERGEVVERGVLADASD